MKIWAKRWSKQCLAIWCAVTGLFALIPWCSQAQHASSSRPAVSSSIVISQVYGGGGNTGATYKNDFVELFNRGNTTVDLNGWTVQYAASTGAFSASLALTGTIAPGRYYLVQLFSSGTIGADLPTPDAAGQINMAGTAGKVALANSSIGVTGSTGANVVDFVGYGSANDFEGSQPTLAPSNTSSVSRSSNGCTDTDNNRTDFATGTPVARNSSTPANNCGATLTASPSTLTNFVATTGADSDEQSYSLTGSSLNAAVTVTAPAGYAVALTSGGPYATSIATGTPVGGSLTSTIYVVMRSTAAGNVAGTITNTSGTTSAGVAVSGTTNAPVTTTQTVRWDGGAGTSYWFDAANWSNDVVPGAATDVVLDHMFVAASYKVLLQSATTTTATVEPAVSIQSLTVNPGGGEPIGFEVPALNTNGSALTLTRSAANEVALAIYNKGTVTNSAGPNANSLGAALTVAGSNPTVYIYNGGTYQHYTNRAHATVVENLAPVAGTEAGRWEFRATNTSSSALSLSRRSYPTLVLRANPAATITNYTGSSTGLLIRGDLIIEPTVVFAPNVTGELKVAGNLNMQGALRFAPTTTGAPTTGQLVLNGVLPQNISGTTLGAVGTDSYLSAGVTLQINNPSGVILATPVTVNGTLQLTAGPLITSIMNPLTLAAGAAISGGGAESFINGPMSYAASGAGSLRFPLGRVGLRGSVYRPLVLTISKLAVPTTFTATQVEEGGIGSLSGGLTRVSRVRYFEVTPTPVPAAGDFAGTITVSYGADDWVNAPEAGSLVIAKNNNNVWSNIGRSAYSGTASSGTITSSEFTSFSWFALASTSPVASQNPLPVELTAFTAQRCATGALLRWATATELNNARFEIWRSTNGSPFVLRGSLPGHGTTTQAHAYHYLDTTLGGEAVTYRLRQVDTDGWAAESPVRSIAALPTENVANYFANPVTDQLILYLTTAARFRVISSAGQVVYTGQATAGTTTHSLAALPAGLYVLEMQPAGQALTRQKLLLVK
ncbi:lamin tail domain-containing protein [Hymenobacter aerilatus]|uniref:Lamin tail domain-containing protein n=1 Tax=Hymenobacter aerilatus TaxID=2932251 RepID=A0A8T9SUZ3_9BACT|nr:lamin tail domain-containing protein [Hymenobacter aerilatus]UOR03596.1 lamin tail domain-containing protein [Hymenobacter aerilatus]